MSSDLVEAITALERDKKISKEVLFDALEAALVSAYRQNFDKAQNVRVAFDEANGQIHVYARKEVAEAVENKNLQLSVDEARAINPNYQIGDTVEIEVTPKNFGRIAAQTARQVVTQRVREAERGMIYNEFIDREGDIMTGIVQRIDHRFIYVDLGRVEALLPKSEQMPNETYRPHDRIKVYITKVENARKGPMITVSRTHPGLLKRLFELEVPEIYDGTVEIKSISREAGDRSKIAVYAEDPEVDAVGACVGQRGARVQTIVSELKGEKIDVVRWSDDPVTYVANALSPSKVVDVIVHEEEKATTVIVPDYQLSLAIGKRGQNARLAAKLTGWKIDIKSETEAEESGLFDEPVSEESEDEGAAETAEAAENSGAPAADADPGIAEKDSEDAGSAVVSEESGSDGEPETEGRSGIGDGAETSDLSSDTKSDER